MLPILLICIAGILSGSFTYPTKYMQKWQPENIWLNFSFFGFCFFPCLVAYFLTPSILSIYTTIPSHLLWITIICGFCFGIGQVCFALSLTMIGIGLSFVFNIGTGMTLGFLLPLVLQYPEKILTNFGIITLSGTFLAIIGLLISNYAGQLRHKSRKNAEIPQKQHTLGVILATAAGALSSGMNFSFSLSSPIQEKALQIGNSSLGASTIMWPIFLFCSFIAYALYMLWLLHKNKSFHIYKSTSIKSGIKYWAFTIKMGAFWYGATLCYSKASHMIGNLGPLVGWPLFMVMIIFTAFFWSWINHEWTHASKKSKQVMQVGLLVLVLAVALLGYSHHLT